MDAEVVYFGCLAIIVGAVIGLAVLAFVLALPTIHSVLMSMVTERPMVMCAAVGGGLAGLICFIIMMWRTR